MNNRTTLAQIAVMEQKEITGLPLAHIAMLLEDVDQVKKSTSALTGLLQDELHRRFGFHSAEIRVASGKDTGTVTIVTDGYKVRADLPRKVEWDQVMLEQGVETIESWGEPIGEYVTVEYRIPEAKYAAWPRNIRKVFEPARTVRTGKPTYKLETVAV